MRRRRFLATAGATAAAFACGGAGASSPAAVPAPAPSGAPLPWRVFRGANGGVALTEKDVADFAAIGGNLLRLSFPDRPLLGLQPPDDFDEQAFAHLERVLVDPHRFPGTGHPYTMLGTREYHGWDAEMSNTDADDRSRQASSRPVAAGPRSGPRSD